jgi:hypothetical protein
MHDRRQMKCWALIGPFFLAEVPNPQGDIRLMTYKYAMVHSGSARSRTLEQCSARRTPACYKVRRSFRFVRLAGG